MDICFNTPLKANRPPGGSSSSLALFPSPCTPPRGEYPPATQVQPSPLLADRYIPDRTRQDMSLSSFLLTAKENMTPLLAMCRQNSQREGSVGSLAPVELGSPVPLVPMAFQDGTREPSPTVASPTSAALHRHASLARLQRGGSSISPGRGGSVASTVSDAFAKMRLGSSSPRRRGAGAVFATRSLSIDGDDMSPNSSMHGGVTGAAASVVHSGLRGAGAAGMSPMDVEPYTSKLARTLFSDAPQTSVLGGASGGGAAHNGNASFSGGPTEQERFDNSLGVVYECNKARNFTSKSFRVIAQTPERILDAADMVDDFYMNLMDWSSTDLLGVALRNVVYLWNAATCNITQLPQRPDSSSSGGGPSASVLVSGLNWAPDGQHLAVGRTDGSVDVWDVETQTVVRHWRQHTARVGSLSWTCSGGLLATGSKDTTIRVNDLRDHQPLVSVLRAHQGEVCGLKWSPGRVHLASGGNDNQLLIWDRRMLHGETDPSAGGCMENEEANGRASSVSSSVLGLYGNRTTQPVLQLNQHVAAVKAIAWNPVQPSLLVSGGGTDDKMLRFWNTLTGECTHAVNTQSQVCGVLWSHSGTELVSSHGFSMNQLTIWKYPSLKRVADLTGHTSRVLHLSMSPDGEVVVSAAGDETIRFWRCFPPNADAQLRATPSSGMNRPLFTAVPGSPAALMMGGSSGNRWAAAAAAAATVPSASSASTSAGYHHDPTYLTDEFALR